MAKFAKHFILFFVLIVLLGLAVTVSRQGYLAASARAALAKDSNNVLGFIIDSKLWEHPLDFVDRKIDGTNLTWSYFLCGHPLPNGTVGLVSSSTTRYTFDIKQPASFLFAVESDEAWSLWLVDCNADDSVFASWPVIGHLLARGQGDEFHRYRDKIID
jgi:hypothetical protein